MGPDDKGRVPVGKKVGADDISSDDISSELSLLGIRCQSIHENREQHRREQALEVHPCCGSFWYVQVNITQY
jgi:hypothetical protein